MQGSMQGRLGVANIAIFAERLSDVIATADRHAVLNKRGRIEACSDEVFARELQRRVKRDYKFRRQMEKFGGVAVVEHHNAYVNTGLNNSLDREFGLGGTAVGFIGVSNNNTAVTAATVFLNGASGGAAANTIIKALSPAASRSSQTVTGGATFVNGDFTSGVFIWNKIGLLTTSTDAGTGLVDVIGGSGGSSPYNRTFSLDLTGAGSFSVVAQIAVTAVAV